MIGAATLDPRQGDRRRQQALQAALAARRRASKMSRTAKTGQGFGARTGVGIRTAGGGGRPSGILNFLSGKSMGAFNPGGFVNYSSAAADLPMSPDKGDGGFGGGDGFGGAPGLGVWTGTPGVDQYGPATPGGSLAQFFADTRQSPTWGLPPGDYDWSQIGQGGAPAPSAPITVGGGLVPLGGGVFLDPDTGQLHGAGMLNGS